MPRSIDWQGGRTVATNGFTRIALIAAIVAGSWSVPSFAASIVGLSVTYTAATNQFAQTSSFSDGSTQTTTGTGQSVDISSAIVANVPVVLNNIEATIILSTAATEYDAVISGTGTLEISQNVNPSAALGTGATLSTQSNNGSANPVPNGAALTITAVQTLALPAALATETTANGVVSGLNPPVLTINPGVSVIFTNNGTLSANLLLSDASGQINLDNILNNGTLSYLGVGSGPFVGSISGAGSISVDSIFFHGASSFSGVLHMSVGAFFGSSIFATTIPNAKAIINEGSMLVSAPKNVPFVIAQNIYESHFGDDINTDTGTNIFLGVYSNSNNTSRERPNLTNPGLVDPSQFGTVVTGKIGVTGSASDFNSMTVSYSGSDFTSLTHTDSNDTQDAALDGGSKSSFRGINIEGGITQWGNGTTNTFFLPATPDNAYINLHNNSTLAINYSGSSGPVVLNVPVGGGQINASLTAPGVGTVHIMNPDNGKADVVFSQPMFYNGPTIIDSGATLQLGAGKPMLTYSQTVELERDFSINYDPATVYSRYSGDSLLLIAQNTPGDNTDSIVDNGTLIVNNTENPIALSNISGTGVVIQASQANAAALSSVPDTAATGQAALMALLPGTTSPALPTLTLTGINSYTGGTIVLTGSFLIVDGTSALGSGAGGLANQGILVATARTQTINVPGDYNQAAAPATVSLRARSRSLDAFAFLGSEHPVPLSAAPPPDLIALRPRVGRG